MMERCHTKNFARKNLKLDDEEAVYQITHSKVKDESDITQETANADVDADAEAEFANLFGI